MYHWDETVVTHADELNNYVTITEEENVEESDTMFVVHAAIADSLMKDDLKTVNTNSTGNAAEKSSRNSSRTTRDSRASAASVEFLRLQGARESRFSSAASVPELVSAKSVTPLMQRIVMFIFLIAAFVIITATSSQHVVVSGLMFAFAPVCVLWFDTYAYRKLKNLLFVVPG
jgi:Flp pilus assembly protein TadB